MKTWLSIFVLLVAVTSLYADVPPDPGYVRQSVDLILESDTDLSGYRFFLESPMKVEEIDISSGGTTTIGSTGRAGAMRIGKLIAVPVNDMAQISGDLSGPLLENFIREKKFPNAKQLLSHDFQATIPESSRSIWKPPVYRLSISDGSIAAIQIGGGFSGKGSKVGSEYVFPVAIGAALFTVAFSILIVFLIRRSGKKA